MKTPHELLAELCQSSPTESRWACEESFASLSCATADGIEVSLAAGSKQRAELRDKMNAGESVELMLSAITFVQIDGKPNRKFVKVKESALAALARTYAGTPFLKDHDTHDTNSRAGTVLSCEVVDFRGGKALRMDLWVTAQWAVSAVLAGNIDRFSVGWDERDFSKVHCSHCEAPVGRKCSHYPGAKLEDGSRVEWVFQRATATEVSAVNMPACTQGTGIVGIRSALSQLTGSITSETQSQEEPSMDTSQIALSLGLSADASPEAITAAVNAQQATAKLNADQVATLGAEKAAADAQIATLSAQRKQAEIDQLVSLNSNKFPVTRDADGGLVASKLELSIRSLAVSDIENARAILDGVEAPTPVGKPMLSVASPGEKPRDTVGPALERANTQLGLSAEDFSKYNPHNGSEIRR